MSPATALEPFMQARTEQFVRASASDALSTSHALSDALDAGIRGLAAPVARTGLAFVALGSYGRREQCRHSDIDVMLLVAGESSDAVDAVLYPLWDTGVKVGHSVRTVEQAMETAQQNVETLTSLLDARLVTGDPALYMRFVAARTRMLQRGRARMFSDLSAHRARLVEVEPWQLQEADVKRSRGGLRDLQAVQWVATANAFATGMQAPALPRGLAEANTTLLAARHALHALHDRAQDRLRRDLVEPVAEILGVEPQPFVRRVVEAMRTVDAEASRTFGGAVLPREGGGSWWRGLRERLRRKPAEADPIADPAEFELLRNALRIAAPGSLDPLPRMQWLGRVLPEWEVLRALPHVVPFHRHPVDVHSWRTVAEARRAMVEDFEETATTIVADELADHDEVLLCALLHDIGKGHEEDHSRVGAVIAERFAARVGLDDETALRLRIVVGHHLALPTVATRRDIADERVVRELAELAGDAHTLRLLYLVAVADARASGPDVWSAWKAQLMRTLYLRTLEHLEAEGEPEAAGERLRLEALEVLSERFGAETVQHHLDLLPASYLLGTPPETIGEHIALIAEASKRTALRHDKVGDVDRLTVVTPDRPGILSLVAGALAVHNVSVLGGVAYTRDDGIAIEVMYVGDGLGHGIDERRWARVFEAVPAALEGRLSVDAELAETRAAYASATPPPAPIPTTVYVDNVGSDAYSIVEVNAADRLGLLYAITNALHDLALDIHVAKVDTIGREVVDAFYVRREDGGRVNAPEEIERLQQRIVEAVGALDGPSAAADAQV